MKVRRSLLRYILPIVLVLLTLGFAEAIGPAGRSAEASISSQPASSKPSLRKTPTPSPIASPTTLPTATPAPGASATIEAESMTRPTSYDVYADPASSGGYSVTMWSNGSLTGTYAGSIASLSVKARGDQCGGAPHLQVLVDNAVALDALVSSTSYADYLANFTASNSTHSLALKFDNDYNSTSCDRNLIADALTLYSSSAPANTPTPTPTTPASSPTATSTASPSATATKTPTATPTASTDSFRFISWGDSKTSNYADMRNISNQATGLGSRLSIFVGDLEDSGFTQSGTDAWKAAINGGTNNGTSSTLFPIRGNHDNEQSNSAANWQAYYDTASVGQAVGVRNLQYLDSDLTYSFDYGNSRFIEVDDPGDASLITSNQLSWVEARLTDAEKSGSGISHAFLFFHSPLVSVGSGHPGLSIPSGIEGLLNRHQIVAATFHGHEHNLAYVHVDSSVDSGLSHPVEMFVTGSIAAGPTSCAVGSYQTAWCQSVFGFATVDVAGSAITVRYYAEGNSNPIKTVQFSH